MADFDIDTLKISLNLTTVFSIDIGKRYAFICKILSAILHYIDFLCIYV